MVKLDQVTDPEKLRHLAVMLDREVDRLHQRVLDLSFENARLRGEPLTQVDLGFPTAAMERIVAGEATASRRAPRPPQPGHGPRVQDQLAVVEQLHELAEADRECKVCGGHLEPMVGQTEDAEEITVEERSYRLAGR